MVDSRAAPTLLSFRSGARPARPADRHIEHSRQTANPSTRMTRQLNPDAARSSVILTWTPPLWRGQDSGAGFGGGVCGFGQDAQWRRQIGTVGMGRIAPPQPLVKDQQVR